MMRTFTREELKKYDGSEGLAYVAYDGKVYDVSQSFLWKKGIHQVVHHAGCDLTEALKTEVVFAPLVGNMWQESSGIDWKL